MARRIFAPNEIKRFSEMLERYICELQQISSESYKIISQITDCDLPHTTEALIAEFPQKKAELHDCIKYFEALREHLDVECRMSMVYAPPEIMKIEF